MSTDPVWRLIALHSADLKDAEDLLFPDGMPVTGGDLDPIEDAVNSFVSLVDEGICLGREEIQLDLQTAERVAFALKQRKKAHRRPMLTQRQRQLRKATVSFAERRADELQREGLKIGAARRQAAEEVSARAHKSGDHIAASTLEKLMKQNAARKKGTQSEGLKSQRSYSP